MGFNRFYASAILFCGLILLSALLCTYFLYGRQQPTTAAGLAVLAFLLTGRMIYHVNRTNRILGNFMMYMRDRDPSLSYTARYTDRNFRGLNESLGLLLKEFKENRIELEVQARYLETILGNVSTGILSFNEDGKVKTMNKAAGEYLGLGVLRHIGELEEHLPGIPARMLALRPREHLTIKVETHGRRRFISLTGTRIRMKGSSINIISLNDISSQMEEQEIESWKKLFRIINHEIMNSITPIITLTLAIRKKLTRDDRIRPVHELHPEELEKVVKSAGIIEERSRDLVKFIERYKKLTILPSLSTGKIRLNELCLKINKLFGPEFKSRGIAYKYPEDDTFVVDADRQMLEQLLINLVRNSMDAAGKTENPEISITCSRDTEQGFFLVVADNGEGIPEEKLEQVFIPFFTTRENGSGIGLSLCRQIMRLHNGQIRIESEHGKGTRVILEF